LTDGHGIPLAVTLTGGNRNDVTQPLPLLDAVPLVCGKPGRPRRKPMCVLGDRGHNHDRYRRLLRARRIWPVVARRGVTHGSGLGKNRWPVERTIAWLHQFRRLRERWEYRADIHRGLLARACCLICWRCLRGAT
jgi:transposase